MKKNIFYLLAHQDDEFGAFIDISDKVKNYNVYILYLTSGYTQRIKKSELSMRDRESIKVLKKIGVKKKNIIFLGKQLDIKCNQLYLNIHKVYNKIIEISQIITPHQLVTHAWEGGHEDHDACNLIARKIGFKLNIINNSKEFSLYNGYKCNFFYFKVFNPIKKNGIFVKANFCRRLFYIILLFFYRSQFKIWIGLYPFIIFHYLFFGYNYLQKLNEFKIVKKPHSGKLLYEVRNFCNFKKFKSRTKNFF